MVNIYFDINYLGVIFKDFENIVYFQRFNKYY